MGRRPRAADRGDLGPRVRPSPLSGSANRGVEDRGGRARALGSVADLPAGDGAKACGRSALERQRGRVIGEFRGVAAEVARLLDEKRSVALVAGHSDNLFDVAYCLAGLQVSFGTTRYIRRTGIIVNKLMTREAFRGTPMTDTLEASLQRLLGHPGHGEHAHVGRSGRSLAGRQPWRPRGTQDGSRPRCARRHHPDRDGGPPGDRRRRSAPDDAADLSRDGAVAERFDAFLPVAMWDDVPPRRASLLRRERRNRRRRVVDGGARGCLRRLPRDGS